jgi:hypothetical protein
MSDRSKHLYETTPRRQVITDMTADEKYREYNDSRYDPSNDEVFPDPEFSSESMRQRMLS